MRVRFSLRRNIRSTFVGQIRSVICCAALNAGVCVKHMVGRLLFVCMVCLIPLFRCTKAYKLHIIRLYVLQALTKQRNNNIWRIGFCANPEYCNSFCLVLKLAHGWMVFGGWRKKSILLCAQFLKFCIQYQGMKYWSPHQTLSGIYKI